MPDQEKKQRKSQLKEWLFHFGWLEDLCEPDFIAPSWKGRILEMAFNFFFLPTIFVKNIGRLASIVFDKMIIKLFTLLKRICRKD
jgi:hypothetical protein